MMHHAYRRCSGLPARQGRPHSRPRPQALCLRARASRRRRIRSLGLQRLWLERRPRRQPRPVIEKLHWLLIGAMKDPERRTRMAGFGVEPIGNTVEEFGGFATEDIARWAKL